MLKDRFGPIPTGVDSLIETVRLRWKAIAIGFEKLTIKNGKMRCYLSDKKPQEYFQSSRFGNVLTFIKNHPKNSNMKEIKNKLLISIEGVGSPIKASEIIKELYDPVVAV